MISVQRGKAFARVRSRRQRLANKAVATPELSERIYELRLRATGTTITSCAGQADTWRSLSSADPREQPGHEAARSVQLLHLIASRPLIDCLNL
jgi:hypothetical protein